jgi:hypothetical protein
MITHCVSATRTPVAAIVNTIPNLSLSSGSATASQTVDQNSPITNIFYTTANATIALSGSLPTGVSGASSGTPSSGATFTISGTPTTAGTFNYTVTATHTDGGCTSSSSGSITVKANTPPYAISAATWQYGNQIWSDWINAAIIDCELSTSLSSSTALYYTIANNVYYYNWPCVMSEQSTLCPSPWRVPYADDFRTLKDHATSSQILGDWGPTGLFSPDMIYDYIAYAWTLSIDEGVPWIFETGARYPVWQYFGASSGVPVKCVK